MALIGDEGRDEKARSSSFYVMEMPVLRRATGVRRGRGDIWKKTETEKEEKQDREREEEERERQRQREGPMRGTRGESGEQHDRERGGWRMAEAPCAVARPGSLFLDIYRAHSKTIDNHTECQFDDEEYLGTRTAPENHSQFPVFQISNNSFWGFG